MAAKSAVLPKRQLVCRATGSQESAKKLAAAAIAASFFFGSAAFADANPGEKFLQNSAVGLSKCADNKKFKKQKDKEIKGLKRRQANYEKDSPVFEALDKSIAETEARFKRIGDSGRFCENSTGFPVYISDPGLQMWLGRSTDMLIPTVGFVYFNCWLFQSGRNYLRWIKETSKNAQEARNRELATNWDYGVALKFLIKGWAWPVQVVNELRSNTFRGNEKYITDAPL